MNHGRPPAKSRFWTALARTGKERSIGADQIEGNLVHKALHPQERREMGVVEDPAADAQKVLEALVADEVLPVHADPGEEGLVGSDDGAVRQGREVAAGGALVEFLQAFRSAPLVHAHSATPWPEAGSRRKASMAAIVSSGALRFGQ